MLIGLWGKEARQVSSLIMDEEEDSIVLRLDFGSSMFGESVTEGMFTTIYTIMKDRYKYVICNDVQTALDSDFIIKLGGKVLNVGDDVWSKFEIELFLKGLEAC